MNHYYVQKPLFFVVTSEHVDESLIIYNLEKLPAALLTAICDMPFNVRGVCYNTWLPGPISRLVVQCSN